MAKSTAGTSGKSSRKSLEDSDEFTFLTASPSGTTAFAELAGRTTQKSGAGVVPVKVFRTPARGKASTTSVISGRSGYDSSESAALQSSLESKLVEQLSMAGSTLFRLTWKRRVTPSGRRYLERQVLEHLTSGNAFGSWPSPCTPNGGRTCSTEVMDATGKLKDGRKHSASLEHAVKFATWPTPESRDGKSGGGQAKRVEGRSMLTDHAMLASWGTPTSRDGKDGALSVEVLEKIGVKDLLSRQVVLTSWATPRGAHTAANPSRALDKKARLEDQVQMTGWTTPQAHDAVGRSQGQKKLHGTKHGCADLVADVRLAGWPTPMAGNPGTAEYNEAGNTDSSRKTQALVTAIDGPARLTASGEMLIGSAARMASGGQLSPDHSRWLQGLPPDWCDSAVTAMVFARRLRKRS